MALALPWTVPAESVSYRPRRPQSGALYDLVERWWPVLEEELAGHDESMPQFVRRAFESYLKCGVAEEGFVRLRCLECGEERALAFSCKMRGVCPSCGARRMHDVATHLVERVFPHVPVRQYVLSPPAELVGLLASRGDALSALGRIFVRSVFESIARRVGKPAGLEPAGGAVSFVQRFTKALTVFPHFHVLGLDGAYVEDDDGELHFHEDPGPSSEDLRALQDVVLRRFRRWLWRHGYLHEDQAPEPLDPWFQSATRESAGWPRPVKPRSRRTGFEVNASVRIGAQDRAGLFRLCRYAARPPLAEAQLEPVDDARIRLNGRSPGSSTTTTFVLHPLRLLRRLAWLVPPPRQHQLRYAGVLAPNAKLRHRIVPAGRVALQGVAFADRKFEPAEPVPYKVAWAKLLAKVYDLDAQRCPVCNGSLRPVGAAVPPTSRDQVERGWISVLQPTGPPSQQLPLPLAS